MFQTRLLLRSVFFLTFMSVSINVFSSNYGVSQPEFRSASHCDSEEDYKFSSQGTVGVKNIGFQVSSTTLRVLAVVFRNQCKKLKNGQYRWQSLGFFDELTFETDAYDAEKKIFKTNTVSIENKKVWVTVINSHIEIVGVGDVVETQKNHFMATIDVPLGKIADITVINNLQVGEGVNVRIGLFLKSLFRYVSKDYTSPYEESSGLGQYDADFRITRRPDGLNVILR